jgi:hypothetical protein
VLLLAAMVWIGYELLQRCGQRPLRLGLLLGLAYLIKTSAWPVLLLAVPLRLWAAAGAGERRAVLASSAVCLAVMLSWIVPMSLEAGHPTLGSSARLNYCWYIEACDSRSPDTHRGLHRSYHQLAVNPGTVITWAEFPDADRWTYEPWSDPTAWEAGVITRQSARPNTWGLISYWGRQAGYSFFLWLSPVFLLVVLPALLVEGDPAGAWRRLVENRSVMTVALLGLSGVWQFILVHAEPRVIAPFGLLTALAVLHAGSLGREAGRPNPGWVRQVTSLAGLLGVIALGAPRIREGIASSGRIPTALSAIASMNASLAAAGLSPERIVIIGPAFPVIASAFFGGVHVVAQAPPPSVAALERLQLDTQRRAVARMFARAARVGWLTAADASVGVMQIPREEEPPPPQAGGRGPPQGQPR